MKLKNVFAVLGTAYAAAVAIAMKKRKDEGTSKLADKTTDSTLKNVMDEIVEIHKNAYNDTKNFVVDNFSDVKDFDTFKDRVADLSKNFAKIAEEKFENIKDSAEDKTEIAKKFLEENYEKAKISLKNAEEKARNFGEESRENAEKFLANSREKIEETYHNLKNKIAK